MAGQPEEEVGKRTTKATNQKNKTRGLALSLFPKVYHNVMKILLVLLVITCLAWIGLSIQGKMLQRENNKLIKERDELLKSKQEKEER